MKTIDLTGYTLLDAYGVERTEINNRYTEESLIKLFTDEWLPWYDCYDICSRAEYCKFPKLNVTRAASIQCGVAIDSIRNFVGTTFPLLETLNKEQIQGYLDGAHYLTKYLFESELNIGRAMDKEYIKRLDDWAPAFFGRLSNLRGHLDNLSAAFSVIPHLQSNKGIVLVEGESEKAFIETLKQSHYTWFLYLNVETYQGKSNRGPSKLRLLLQRYLSQGYTPYIQGDADGGYNNVFDALIESNPTVKKENTFVFNHDFETAIPKEIAYKALNIMGYLREISFESFTNQIKDSNLIYQINAHYGLDLQKEKVIFAQTVANILNHDSMWHKNEDFLRSELGQFLLFLRKID